MKTAKEFFETCGEAMEYCRDNGFISQGNIDPWELADKIIDIRNNQDKITRHACVKSVNILYGAIDNSVIGCEDVTRIIMNTKAI